MKYVGVRHNPDDKKIWWFSVPEMIDEFAIVGRDVICKTKNGKSKGVIRQVLDNVPQSEAEKIIGKNFPLKPVIAIQVYYPMDEIGIPYKLEASHPNPQKIAKRFEEAYAERGGFQTEVVFNQYGRLKDGYTAYLAARALGRMTLRGYIRVFPEDD